MICKAAQAVHDSVYDCLGYRLPTLAEWEYAARAGTRTAFYTGDITVNKETGGYSHDKILMPIAWYWYNSGGGTDIYQDPFNEGKTTHPVERKQPNDWELYDMLGNVMEWTWDSFSGGGFDGIPQTDPVDDGTSERHALKGGGAAHPSPSCRLSAHFEIPISGDGYQGIGLRLVRTVSWPKGDRKRGSLKQR
jgi:formylglycine-generating enzyme required for sulfatase activity